MRGKKIDRAVIAAYAAQGRTVYEIAAMLNAAPISVLRAGNTSGVKFVKRRIGPSRRASSPIVEAIRVGVDTAPEIAKRIGVKRTTVSVRLQALADDGTIIRKGTPACPRGRPPVKWKLAEHARTP